MNSGFKLFVAILLVAGIAACAGHSKEKRMTVRQNIAESYGLQHFSEVEKLQYTFNVKKGEDHVYRFWIWEPHLDRVTFKGMDYQDAVTYDRSDIGEDTPEKIKKIDAWFINDKYWLLFPFQVTWDTNAKVEDLGRRKLPMGDGSARCVVVTYPPAGGYTPGDVYEIYLDDRHRLTQWVYRRGGSEKPTRITTWEDHRKIDALTFSLNHLGEDQNFRVWFTNVGVKLIGVDSWMFVQ